MNHHTPDRDSAPRSYQSAAPRANALAVLGGDGDLEIYGPSTLDVLIVNRPYLPTPQGEILAEEYLDLTLPQSGREIFFPGMIRARRFVEKLALSDLLLVNYQREVLRALDQLQDAWRT